MACTHYLHFCASLACMHYLAFFYTCTHTHTYIDPLPFTPTYPPPFTLCVPMQLPLCLHPLTFPTTAHAMLQASCFLQVHGTRLCSPFFTHMLLPTTTYPTYSLVPQLPFVPTFCLYYHHTTTHCTHAHAHAFACVVILHVYHFRLLLVFLLSSYPSLVVGWFWLGSTFVLLVGYLHLPPHTPLPAILPQLPL